LSEEAAQAIIGRMLEMYPPPVHLRHSGEAMATAIDTYRRGLSRYDSQTLDAAWQLVCEANEYWTWPKLSELLKACERCTREARGEPAGPSHDERIEQANTLASAYTRRFMQTSRLAIRAREEGWERSLRDYVDAAAWVQGQMLAGCSDIAYSSVVLFDYTQLSREELEERSETFFAKAREQAAKGHIRVSVPAYRIEAWQAACEEGQGRARAR
jgi:hypothetical protein